MNYDDVSKFNIKCVSHVTIFITRITSDLSRNGEMTGQLYSLAVAAQVFISSRTDNSHTRHLLLRVCLYGKIHLSFGVREIGQKNICLAMRILKEAFCAVQLCHFRGVARTSVRIYSREINSNNCNRLNSALCTFEMKYAFVPDERTFSNCTSYSHNDTWNKCALQLKDENLVITTSHEWKKFNRRWLWRSN